MVNKSTITTFIAVFLIAGSIFISMPKDANAGVGIPPDTRCCQVFGDDGFSCSETNNLCITLVGNELLGTFPGAACDAQTGFCEGFEPENLRNVPTLSEWGLIAMAGVLGIVGFMVIRRKRVTA